MPRRISHFIVTHAGKPCALIKNDAWTPKGILLPVTDGDQPVQFMCDAPGKRRTTYAKRRAHTAIRLTDRFVEESAHSITNDHEFVKRAVAATGLWRVIPIKCPLMPKLK